ncbi:MAG: Gfo/Idh/MocA family oxidoreductase [Planctomycetia bacterium]|nr:Gfo/Idh/MocA family oxidoreductase [Planctomycetia bacterium]RLT13315.1 MAG: gfo/Idh/MocA family oxidoreductase [Planctomycetota bacterium]
MRVAIIGIGAIARLHARALAGIDGITLVAASCRTEEKGRAFAEEFNCVWYGDTSRMLRREKLDFVTVATPSGAHLDAVTAAARRGIHVICEKPLEISLKRIDRMLAATSKAGVTLGAIFPQRFNPVVQAVHAAARAGRFGQIAVAVGSVPWWRDDSYYGAGRWQGTLALDGGGSLMNQSIHSVDALQWIVAATMPELGAGENPVQSVLALTATRSHPTAGLEVEDTCVAVLRFRNGALGQILAATSLYPGQLRRFLFGGRDGTAEIVEEQLTAWQFRDAKADDDATRGRFSGASTTSGGAADPMAIADICHQRNFREFIQALSAGRSPSLDGREGRKAVAIVTACYESARTGKCATVK